MTDTVATAPPLTVMTVNTHKGFTTFNRKFILPELRDAVRKVGADVVFLQEVLGTHEAHGKKVNGWPDEPHYEFLADEIWPQFAYGRNMVYPKGHHGNAVMSKFPIVQYQNHDVSIAGPEKRGLLHCVLNVRRPGPGGACDLRAPGPGRGAPPAAARAAVRDRAHRGARRRAADRGGRLQRLAPPRASTCCGARPA